MVAKWILIIEDSDIIRVDVTHICKLAKGDKRRKYMDDLALQYGGDFWLLLRVDNDKIKYPKAKLKKESK